MFTALPQGHFHRSFHCFSLRSTWIFILWHFRSVTDPTHIPWKLTPSNPNMNYTKRLSKEMKYLDQSLSEVLNIIPICILQMRKLRHK